MPRKGENIYKRKDNRWEARYIKGYRIDGSIKYGYCYGKTYREAKEKLSQIKAVLLNNGIVPTQSRKRFAIYCDEWIQLNRSKVKESTLVKYLTNINNHIKPALGGYYVQAIDSLTIEQFSHNLLTVDGLAPKTVRDILTLLQSILKYAAKQLPLSQTVDIIFPKDPKKEMRVLTIDEQKQFTQYLLTNPDECKFGILLALLTGLRIGEICALKWKDISLNEKTICVSSTMQRLKNLEKDSIQKTKIVVSNPKSDNSMRIIPMGDYTAELCAQWYISEPSAYVLTGMPNRFIEPRSLQYRLGKYTKACNLEGVHFHTLRHP